MLISSEMDEIILKTKELYTLSQQLPVDERQLLLDTIQQFVNAIVTSYTCERYWIGRYLLFQLDDNSQLIVERLSDVLVVSPSVEYVEVPAEKSTAAKSDVISALQIVPVVTSAPSADGLDSTVKSGNPSGLQPVQNIKSQFVNYTDAIITVNPQDLPYTTVIPSSELRQNLTFPVNNFGSVSGHTTQVLENTVVFDIVQKGVTDQDDSQVENQCSADGNWPRSQAETGVSTDVVFICDSTHGHERHHQYEGEAQVNQGDYVIQQCESSNLDTADPNSAQYTFEENVTESSSNKGDEDTSIGEQDEIPSTATIQSCTSNAECPDNRGENQEQSPPDEICESESSRVSATNTANQLHINYREQIVNGHSSHISRKRCLDKRTKQNNDSSNHTSGNGEHCDDDATSSVSNDQTIDDAELEESAKSTNYYCYICDTPDRKCTLDTIVEHFKECHLVEEENKVTLQCKMCTKKYITGRLVRSAVFFSMLSCLNHMVEKHDFVVPDFAKLYRCTKCAYTTLIYQSLIRHCSQHDCSLSRCDTCGKLMKPISLKNHIRTCGSAQQESEKTAFSCQMCGQSFTSKGSLVLHVARKHNNQQLQLCQSCPASFFAKADLERHMFSQHGVNISKRKVDTCPICNFQTLEGSQLRKHMKNHEFGLFPCTECGKVFGTEKRLKSHLMTHNAKKKHKCPSCDYVTYRRYHLERHQSVMHDGVSWRCHLCNMTTFTSANLQKHFDSKHPGESVHPDFNQLITKVAKMEQAQEQHSEALGESCPGS